RAAHAAGGRVPRGERPPALPRGRARTDASELAPSDRARGISRQAPGPGGLRALGRRDVVLPDVPADAGRSDAELHRHLDERGAAAVHAGRLRPGPAAVRAIPALP